MPADTVAGRSAQIVNPLEDSTWDAKLGTCAGASIFHGAAWARVLHDTYGFKPIYFALVDADRIHAVLPLMEVKSWLTGRRGVGLPFSDECAPLCSDAGQFEKLFSSALAHARQRKWNYIECRGGQSLFGSAVASTTFFDHQLDLTCGERQLFAQTEASVRRAVRKAEQSCLSVSVSQHIEAVESFYRLLCKTRQRHGLPPQPFDFFAQIQRHILSRGQGHVVLARLNGTPVAGSVFFHAGETAIYKFGASDDSFQQLRANNLVMWEAIKWHAQRKFIRINFGRTSLENEGLRRFKLGWGATETRSTYVRYDLSTDQFVTVKDESSGWHTRVFRKMPISLARLVGRLLYRHIA